MSIVLDSNLPFNNFDYNFCDRVERNTSEVSNKLDVNWTRTKTKVFSIDAMKYMREESDPAFRPSVFNENNNFTTADHYFGLSNSPWRAISRNNLSNPLLLPPNKEIIPLKTPTFAD
mmetsp:Transcript_18322/g.21070  ORF Transcript_18322/g.21070 Transcript_18322/m.21070 type:complete len:117 (+) Transcript_18322:396-746(+)